MKIQEGIGLYPNLIESNKECGCDKYATFHANAGACLGSFSKRVAWDHGRCFISYLDNNNQPAYINLTFLRDGAGYCSAVFTFNFATDYGSLFLNFDPASGRIEAEDLRLRFEIGSNLDGVTAAVTETESVDGIKMAALKLNIGAQIFTVKNLFTGFEGEKPYWSISRNDQTIFVDYVIYSGAKKVFDFHW